MRRYRILTVFIACIAMSSLCSCKSEVDHEEVITVNLAEVNKKRVINLSDWVSVPEFIALDSSSENAYNEGGNCCVSDNYIGLYGSSQVYKLYDRRTGKYLRNIGRIGKNSGEYTNVYRSEINEENSMVYILPWTAKELLCYDLNTGELIEARQLKYNVPKGAFAIDPETGELTVATLPFEGENETVVWKQDKEDNVLWEVPAGDLSLVPDYSHEIVGAFNDKERWGRMSLVNVAKSGFFAADRSIKEYADNIWHLQPVK